jgi:Xaa-Pro aminopeptidase
VRRLGFEEDHCTVRQLKLLRKNAPAGIRLIGARHLVEALRECKQAEEIRHIKKALAVHEASFRYLKNVVRPGLSEHEVFLKLERFVKERGCGFSFEPIVASGPNSCFPHARVTKRVIRANDIVLIDWGIDHKGYKSDLTRMFFLGRIPKLIRTVNDTVIAAQKKAIERIRHDVPIAQVDYQARNYLQKHGLARFFGHSLGHGVGLEIHESPRVSQFNKGRLKEGMIITVEPGVYLPGRFGIRIEDMVLVTKKGAQVLSGHIY